MNTEQKPLEQIEQDVLAATSNLSAVDRVMKSRRAGTPEVVGFLCSGSGLVYPSDYVREWGWKYGRGLGPDVVSEALESAYHIRPAPVSNRIRSKYALMHPVRVSRDPVHLVTVSQAVADAHRPVLHIEDEDHAKRAPIMWERQMKHPLSRLPLLARLQGVA